MRNSSPLYKQRQLVYDMTAAKALRAFAARCAS